MPYHRCRADNEHGDKAKEMNRLQKSKEDCHKIECGEHLKEYAGADVVLVVVAMKVDDADKSQ